MNCDLTTDQREIQALTRDFACKHIEPNARDWDREHRFPRELYTQLAELGLELDRIDLPNADPAFIRALVGLVEKASRAEARIEAR